LQRYVLFLQDLLKNTVKGHPDYLNLLKAVEIMKDLADCINANKGEYDEVTKLSSIEAKFTGWDKVWLIWL
jgi:hypothetical protein